MVDDSILIDELKRRLITAEDRASAAEAALRKGEVSPAAMPGSLLERTRHFRGSLGSDATDKTAQVGFTRTVGTWSLVTLHEFGTKSMPRRGLLTADPETSTLGQGDIEDIGSLVNLFLDDLL